MEQAWRWFGPDDPVTLDQVRQAGATGIVTALHHRQDGTVWPDEEVRQRRGEIEAAGLVWSVVESIPVPDAIKLGGAEAGQPTAVFADSLRAVGRAGIKTVCYNFMPVVDWTRTALIWRLPSTGYALRFDAVDFATYDAFILRRSGAEADHRPEVLARARERFAAMSAGEQATLERTIIAGLPGVAGEVNDRARFERRLASYVGMTSLSAREPREPAQKVSPLAGLATAPSSARRSSPVDTTRGSPNSGNGARVLGPRPICAPATRRSCVRWCRLPRKPGCGWRSIPTIREFAPQIHFAHLRNVTTEPDGSFYEAEHLDGGTDMVAMIGTLLAEEARRGAQIPMRPDHGHLLADDIGKHTNPGYSLIGRLKGLAELRGVIRTLERLGNPRPALAG